ncbi:MAG: prolyl oligopeptidase family serine peptidase [Pirellulales bacterium]
MLAAAAAWGADHDTDPHRWLEEVADPRALEWVQERNRESTSPLTARPDFEPLRERFLDILNSTARIPPISKHGPHFYNFWRDARNKRGLWRRTSLDEYRRPSPAWEIVLDLDELAAAEQENWVWKGAQFLEPTHDRVLLSLSRGGADATVIREFDPQQKRFVEGGFQLPEAKSRVAWRGPDSLFVASDFGPGSLTDSGYPRIVKEWRRGTPLSEAQRVFEGQASDVSVAARRDLTVGFERDFVSRSITFWTSELYLRRGSELIRIDKPDDANAQVHREWLLIELRSDWHVAGRVYPAGAQLIIHFDRFLAGDRQFDLLFEPAERRSLVGVIPTRNHFLVNELDNVRDRIYVVTRKGDAWQRVPLPGTPEFSSVGVSAVDPDESDDYFLTVSDYLTPTTLEYGQIGRDTAEPLKANPAFFSAQGLVVHQREAVSRDGTQVPYFEVSRQELELNGEHPTLLYGYGGFEIPLVPGYQPLVGSGWLERGGVYVVANIRGGGEFGPRWHQAALKANRHRAYEDFVAVADDLVRRKVTSPRRLGAMGGSNGGLLMGNMLTLYPERFGAIVCQVPLLDMQRYHKLLAGASWVAEYGDPDKPAEWEFLRTFSPYHNVRRHGSYPPVLVTTSTRDDRVHPGHARKMVARLREFGHRVAYYENIEGGHGGAADNPQTAYMWALAYTFLWQQLGEPQP